MDAWDKRKRERDVLYPMSVTLDVSHFERSPLNTRASLNAIQKKQKGKKLYRQRKKVRRTILLIIRFIINTRYRWVRQGGREREGRTSSHLGDTGYIPLWEITVELTCTFKRYTKENKKIKSIQKKKESKKNYFVNNKIHYQYKI